MGDDIPSIVEAIERVATKFSLCRNRLWAVVRNLEEAERHQLLQLSDNAKVGQTGVHEGHDECTFDFCEHSRLDFTAVPQRHESCGKSNCSTKKFSSSILEEAIDTGKPTAWMLDGTSVIEPPKPFMAISHVWSDGTGAGAWPPGQVNECLYNFFKDTAELFQCDGIWWDTICIPLGKAARSKTIVNIHRNYEDARITLVHDSFLRNWEWVNPEIACFAIILSPWFSRGWTALELAKSRKVKIIFKGTQHPVIKDLDEDILAKADASPPHQVASRVVRGLRESGIDELNGLLTVLGPRYTSWPRDVAIISGQLAGITVSSGASQQSIYQEILKKMGKICRGHLFHNSTTMSKGFTWCPTNLFDIRQSSAPSTLLIGKNGDVTGNWNVFCIPDDLQQKYNWKDTHPLIEEKLLESLKDRDGHRLLVDPKDDPILRALVVETMSIGIPKRVRFVGPVYFHTPLTIQEFGELKTRQTEKVIIDGDVGTETRKEKEAERQPGSGDVKPFQKSDLLSATADGDAERLQLLLLEKPDLNVQDEKENTPLHWAAQNGHKAVVELLLGSEAEPNILNSEKKTGLHLAALNGYDEVVKSLLKKAAASNLKDTHTWTALHYATWKCYHLVVQRLLDGGANINLQDRLGQNALHLAAERGNREIVNLLVGKGANLNARCRDKQTALHRAAWGGSKEVAKLLLQSSTLNLNLLDEDKRTALHIAADKGQTSVVALLLQHKAVPDIQDSKEHTALHLAAQNGYEDVVRLLLDSTELELEDYQGLTPLLLAVRNGHRGIVEMLLNNSASVESRSGTGKTPLMWAAERGHKDVVELLLNARADLKAVDNDNQTALLSASENGHKEVVKLLLAKGAELEGKDSGGQTPLLWAATKGHEVVARLLLELGADPETRDNNNQSPLLAATKYGHEAVVKLLLEKNVNLEHNAQHGQTSLSWAARIGHEAIVRLLLKKGAHVNPKDIDGYTPLERAVFAFPYRMHEPLIMLLLEHGAKLGGKSTGDILARAVQGGNVAMARRLLDIGVELDIKTYGVGQRCR